jgi:hypothetical protein
MAQQSVKKQVKRVVKRVKVSKVEPQAPIVPDQEPKPKVLLGLVEQVRRSVRKENRLSTLVGFVLGGFVPLASWTVAHYEVSTLWSLQALFVLGGLVYSAKTVYEWGTLAFENVWKSLGFVVLTEGIMVMSTTGWLNIAALSYLVAINGLATGVRLSLQERKKVE